MRRIICAQIESAAEILDAHAGEVEKGFDCGVAALEVWFRVTVGCTKVIVTVCPRQFFLPTLQQELF